MDVALPRQLRGIDLHHRPEHHEMPIWSQHRQSRDEVEVHAFVDDAEEAEARARQVCLV